MGALNPKGQGMPSALNALMLGTPHSTSPSVKLWSGADVLPTDEEGSNASFFLQYSSLLVHIRKKWQMFASWSFIVLSKINISFIPISLYFNNLFYQNDIYQNDKGVATHFG